MSVPSAVLSLVTLGVSDLERSSSFYDGLGFQRKARAAEGVCFFQAGAMNFAVWPLDELAEDAGIVSADLAAFRGVALAWNCRSAAEVDRVVERARRLGATVRKPPVATSWGGYAGYFADPDGHLWEVAHNPHWSLTDDGRLRLPD